MGHPTRLITIALVLGGVCWSLVGRADDGWQPRERKQPGNRLAYPVDSILDLRIHEASRLETRGRFTRALEIYREVLRANSDTDPNVGNRIFQVAPGRYQGVSEFVRARLRGFPPDGKQAWREARDVAVRGQLKKITSRVTDDAIKKLDAVYADDYLATDAPRALELAADLDFERGEVEAAVERYQRLVLDHPGMAGSVHPKLIVALSLAGRPEALRELIHSMKQIQPEAGILIAGRELSPDAMLALAILRQRQKDRDGSRGALGASRGAHSPQFSLGEHLWSHSAIGRVISSRPRTTRALGLETTRPGRSSGLASPHYPVVSDNQVVMSSADQLQVLSLDDGSELLGRPLQVLEPTAYAETNDRVIYGGTVHRELYAAPFVERVLNEEYWRGIPIKVNIPMRKLVAFDTNTWKRLWDHTESLADSDLEYASFPCPPAAQRGVLYSSAFLVRGFVQSWVAAFDARSGKTLWRTWLCSGQVEQTMFGEHAVEPLCSPVVVANETVYHITSFGAVAALEAKTGRIRWITEYDQIEVKAAKGYYPSEREIGWHNTPPVLVDLGDHGGRVLVTTPLDSDYYYAFDADRGGMLWNYPRNGLEYLVGTTGGRVILAGEDRVVAHDVRTGKHVWEVELRPPLVPRTELISGRGTVTDKLAFIPLRSRVLPIEVASGKVLAATAWRDHTDGGNLFATKDKVMVCSPTQLHTHANRDLRPRDQDGEADTEEESGEKPRKKRY